MVLPVVPIGMDYGLSTHLNRQRFSSLVCYRQNRTRSSSAHSAKRQRKGDAMRLTRVAPLALGGVLLGTLAWFLLAVPGPSYAQG